MDFTSDTAAQMGMAAGNWAVRSRWDRTGAGRADVRAVNGDAPNGAALSECWDATFSSTFLDASWDPSAHYGNEATDCVFKTAEYSKL